MRYDRNIGTLTADENEKMKDYKVCVIGCGGLGAYVIEMLGRLGVGSITAIDGDVFEESNLNRQLLSDMSTIGRNKAHVAKERMQDVNPHIEVKAICTNFNNDNGIELLSNHNIVVDALDDITSRFELQDISCKLNIPMIHGAIAGWYGQVCTILAGDNTLNYIYPKKSPSGAEKKLGNPSFTPAIVAGIQVSETIKVLTGKKGILRKKLLYIDLLTNDYDVIEF